MGLKINEIHQGNCLELLRLIDDRSIHLIFTSPPYNCGIKYDVYNDNKKLEDYFAFMKQVFTEVYRVLVSGGRIAVNIPEAIQSGEGKDKKIIFVGTYFQKIFDEVGFITREHITWIKGYNENNFQGNNTAWGSWKSPSNPYMRSLTEKVVVLSKETLKLDGNGDETDLTADEFKEWTKNCWFVPTDSSKDHPATFPFDLAKRVIKLYSWKHNTVMDIFSGRGTTCIMAKKLGRNYIGLELSENYCNISRKALNEIMSEVEVKKQEEDVMGMF